MEDPEDQDPNSDDLLDALEVAAYERKKEDARERSRTITKAGQDIGPLRWDNVDWDRRISARDCFHTFIREYLVRPDVFDLPDADYHAEFRKAIQASATVGNSQAFAVPRGGGKSQHLKAGVMWGLLYGWRYYVIYVGGDERSSAKEFENVKTEMRSNEKLIQDFPEVCYPLYCLGDSGRSQKGQHIDGAKTESLWSSAMVYLPTVKPDLTKIPEHCHPYVACKRGYSLSSGSIIEHCGINQGIRGSNITIVSGYNRRPDWLTCDDLQTDRSARSEFQIKDRLETIRKALGWSGGPDRSVGVMVGATVIQEGDVADQLVDREQNASLHGIRYKMLENMPDDFLDRIAPYKEYRQSIQRDDTIEQTDEPELCRQKYVQLQQEIEVNNIRPTWSARHEPLQVNAIHFAVDMICDWGFAAFMSEAQNQPLTLDASSVKMKPQKIMAKQHDAERGEVPRHIFGALDPDTDIPHELMPKLAVAIDVQPESLWHGVAACSPTWVGAVIDYGIYPEQGELYSRRDKIQSPLSSVYPGAEPDRVKQALIDRIRQVADMEFPVEGSSRVMKPEIIAIDCSYQTKIVGAAVIESGVDIAIPIQGHGLGIKKRPINNWSRKKGEIKGHNYIVGRIPVLYDQMILKSDINPFKTQVHQSLRLPLGNRGSWSLWNEREDFHEMFAHHLCSESDKLMTDESTKQSFREWSSVGHAYNEFLDVMVYLMTGLARLGCVQPDTHLFFEDKDEDQADDTYYVELVDFEEDEEDDQD